jgi:uncharacterized protein (TIRG00374 family)
MVDQPAPTSPPRRERSPLGLTLKVALALGVSIGAAWWAFRDADTERLSAELGKTSLGVVAGLLITQLLGHVLRVARWALLVKPLGGPSYRAIFAAASVGFPASFFLPLRLGELVRPVMISRSGVPLAGAMASVVVERIADGLVSVGFFFVFLRLLPADAALPEQIQQLASLALFAFGGALVALIVATVAKQPAFALLRRLFAPIPAGLREKLLGLLETFVDGLTALRTAPRVLAFLALTVAFWGLMGVVTWALASSYVPDLSWVAGPFTSSVVVFAIMVPAGPAFVGTMELGFKLGLAPFAVDADTALAAAVVFHVLQLVHLAILAGLGFLAAETRQRGQAAAPAPGSPR